jgi:hypothetical protein
MIASQERINIYRQDQWEVSVCGGKPVNKTSAVRSQNQARMTEPRARRGTDSIM